MNGQTVSDFYQDKSVLVTGATGFLAKVLLEKLLYSCHGLKSAYILIRRQGAKAGGPQNEERFEELLKSKVFDRLREKRPDALSKVVPVWGDVAQPGLGLSAQERQLLISNASIVFHSAATTKFNEPLKVALGVNLIGTKNVLELFQSLERKDAFVYVSTAFSNCNRSLIEEVVYPSPVPVQFLIESQRKLSESTLDLLFECISEGRPNTYTFSKAMAETYLQETANDLPVVIVRPSIVGPSLKEPSVGWLDSKSLIGNAMHAIGLGLIHCLPINEKNKFDLIPADLTCNLTVVAAWAATKKSSDEKTVPVYNCVSGCDNCLTFADIEVLGLKYGDAYPSTLQVAYPFVIFSKNRVIVKLSQYFHHYLPAITLDVLRTMKGKGPKYLAIYRRFFAALPFKTFFLEREFNFQTANTRALLEQLTEEEKREFNFDVKCYKWEEYIYIWADGMRKMFYPNESGKDDPQTARKHVRGLFWRMVLFNSLLAAGMTTALYASVLSPLYKYLYDDQQH